MIQNHAKRPGGSTETPIGGIAVSALRALVPIQHDRGLTAPAEAMSAHSGLNRSLQIIYTLYFHYSKCLTALLLAVPEEKL